MTPSWTFSSYGGWAWPITEDGQSVKRSLRPRRSALEGADGHCQVGNLPLSAAVLFDWLDETLAA
jgi:hypothetical protein